MWIWVNTVFILTSRKTEIARSVRGPKLQEPRAEDALAETWPDSMECTHVGSSVPAKEYFDTHAYTRRRNMSSCWRSAVDRALKSSGQYGDGQS